MHLNFITDIQFWFFIGVQIAGFILLFAKSYSTEKGKNLATKEDIGGITQIIESIKSYSSYKNEHLIHLRASERSAIIDYYKATEVLVLNFKRPDLVKNEIDGFDEKNGTVSDLELRRYISEAELVLTKIREDISNLTYLRDISESELIFFYDELELNSIINKLNLSLSELERHLIGSINSLLQVFTEIGVKINAGQLVKELIIEAKRKRSEILTNWYENRINSLSFIRTFNQDLKEVLHHRLKSLAS